MESVEERGITWQRFLRILRLRTDVIDWALRDTLTWNEFVKRVERSIDRYSTINEDSG